MDIYLVNLARRPDRLAAMEIQARALGLSLTRLDAVDAKEAEAGAVDRWFADDGPLGEIPRGDKCCSLSHRAAWERLVASSATHAAILEDDVVLRPDAAFALGSAGWIPPSVDLLKLEHYGPPGQSVLLSNITDVGPGFRIGRMRSRHTGAAAYILSRRAAEILLSLPRFDLPVDHLLFNPNNSRLFARLNPWQLLPVVARQQDFVGDKSDIEGWRVGLRKFDLTYVRRELVRFGYDLKLLPVQLALLGTGRAKFVRVGA
ncbi:MAG: glycosyltransferase family 25 protein [Alphaproteobacteria bacterium]|nr:glycosyltransferase family 25 protein [Alphaproteobacteria bacterium]